jgi:hypothetical protein
MGVGHMPARNGIRDAEALSYRARGFTYQRIANEMGWTDRSAARKACERALAADIRETTDEAKALLLMDLNAAKQAVWAVLEANHLVISDGRVVKLDDTPIPDDEPVLRAVDRLVKINQEIAKIYGVYAPVKSEVITLDAVEAEIRKLEAEVGNSGHDQAGAPPLPA